MSKHIPLLLLATIGGCIVFDSIIPLWLKALLYALSISIKSVIVFILPFLIFALLARAILELQHEQAAIIPISLVCMTIVNFFATWSSHFIGTYVYSLPITLAIPEQNTGLQPWFTWIMPEAYIGNSTAMMLGCITGLLASQLSKSIKDSLIVGLSRYIQIILSLISCLVIPFILGCMIKLQYDGILITIFQEYAYIVVIIMLTLFCYLSMLYYVANYYSVPKTLQALRHLMPAALTGLTSMSSAAALPLSIIGIKKIKPDARIAPSIMPITVNFHLIGDCFAIPILAFTVLKNFGYAEPGWYAYTIFACYFVLTKFSAAAVPGGSMIVMLPVLEKQLHFTDPMLSLITALYMLFDPLITAANVLGNNGFALLLDNIIFPYLFQKKEKNNHENI